MGQRHIPATVEFMSPTRLHPPVFETADIVVAAPPEVTRPAATNAMTRLRPVVMAIAIVGMMAMVFLSRSGVARNPVFMMFPLMMLFSAVSTVVSGADRQRGPGPSGVPAILEPIYRGRRAGAAEHFHPPEQPRLRSAHRIRLARVRR